MACMYGALRSEGLDQVRLIGFDSFEGLPQEAGDQGWRPGEFYSSLPATLAYLRRNGVDTDEIEMVAGWFRETCRAETAERLGIRKASLILVDCDIYSASRDALAFCAPLICDSAVIIFDDWGWSESRGMIGQKEAFSEFLTANPRLIATSLDPAYIPQARIFHLRSRA